MALKQPHVARAAIRMSSELPGLPAIRTPTFMFCVWVMITVSLSMLGWSYLTSDGLDPKTLGFLAIAWLVFMVGSLAFPQGLAETSPAPMRGSVVVLLLGYYAVASWRNGGIPIIQLLSGQAYDVYGFGIPGVHVAVLALTGYLAVRTLHLYVARRAPRDLIYTLATVAMLIAIANRSAVSFVVFCWFVILLRRWRLTFRRMAALACSALALIALFGLFGDVRLGQQILAATGNDTTGAIVLVSRATDAFYETGLPTQFLWGYVYLVSPVVNLNEAFRYAGDGICGQTCDLQGLATWELLPDIISRRLVDLGAAGEFDKSAFLKVPELTASTTFGSAVGYAGLLGAALVLLALVLLVMQSYAVLRSSEVREEGLAILSCILFFSFFENMIAYSPLFLQLLIALFRSRHRLSWL
jgi:hypothetical protein